MTMALGDVGGKVAVLRTFRVLRALKTVAVVPGKVLLLWYYNCLYTCIYFLNVFMVYCWLIQYIPFILLVLVTCHLLNRFLLFRNHSVQY